MNILIKKWREAEVSTNLGVQGKWKVEVVCPNGEIKKPLGDEWRPNMIQDRGLNLLQGQTLVGNGSTFLYSSSYGGLAHTINGAIYGYDRPINIFDQNATSYNNQLQSLSANTAATSKVTRPCSFETDTINGSRTVKKIYDFNAVPLAQQIREVGIAQISLPSNTSFAVGSLGSNVNIPIFSRFLIPGDGITLEQFQFLRLTYSLQMTISATINAVPIAVQSNGFDGTGQLKCVGSFDNLFGKINGDGTPVAGYSDVPWAIIGRNLTSNSTVPGCAAALISVELVNNVWTTPNFSDTNTDFAPQNVIAGTSINASSPGSSTTPASANTEQLNLSGPSVTKEATILFPASNPAAGANIGGVFFRSRPDNMEAVPNAGWYWKFTDGAGNNQPQYKDPNYALAINVSQTVTRV